MGGRFEINTNDPMTWRTVLTDMPAIQGGYPPNVMAEEIVNEHPDRLRAVLTFAANPLHSYADTTAFEEAFRRLDLLAVVEVAMSETVALAGYVLPSKTAYESWTGTIGLGSRELYGRMRRPVVEAEGEQKEAAEIFTLLADAVGLIPELPQSLYLAATSGNIREYRDALTDYLQKNPESGKVMQFIVAKTLGRASGSAHLSGLFAQLLLQRSQASQEEAARAGFAMGPDQGLDIYQAILDRLEGVLVGIREPASAYKNIERLPTSSGRSQLHVPEVKIG